MEVIPTNNIERHPLSPTLVAVLSIPATTTSRDWSGQRHVRSGDLGREWTRHDQTTRGRTGRAGRPFKPYVAPFASDRGQGQMLRTRRSTRWPISSRLGVFHAIAWTRRSARGHPCSHNRRPMRLKRCTRNYSDVTTCGRCLWITATSAESKAVNLSWKNRHARAVAVQLLPSTLIGTGRFDVCTGRFDGASHKLVGAASA